MAKVAMKYVEIAAPVTESKMIIDFLQLKGIMEFKKLNDVDELVSLSADKTVSTIDKYSDTARTALEILNKYSPEKSSLTDMLKNLPEMTQEEYQEKSEQADDILGVCYDIVSAEKKISENNATITRCKAAIGAVEPWLSLDVPMQYKGTASTDAFIGYLPNEYTSDSLAIALAPYLDEDCAVECEIVSRTKERSCIFALASKQSSEKALSALRAIGFSYPSDPTKHVPAVRYERMKKKIEDCEKENAECESKIIALASNREDIKFVCDWFSVRHDKYEALSNVCSGGSFIALGGYVPAAKTEKLVKELDDKFSVAVTVSDPEPEEDVPVLLENKPFVAAVEPITDLYSPPGKDDIDPNPVMAIFYYLLFGIMLSDAGYGLLMAVGCGIAKFKFKVKGKMKKTVDMYFWCGLATLFWGTLFGSWFGDIFEVVAREFFNVADLGARLNDILGFTLFRDGIALWFQPVNNPMKLMCYSFLFGIVHLFAGLAASFVKMWKHGNKAGAFFDCIPVAMTVLGIIPIGATMLQVEVSSSLKTYGLYLAAAGAILIVLTAGRDSKNIVGKLGLGLYGLYNTASGWLSDILSYSRLLALGLCTGVIASVVNTLGVIPGNKIVKAVLLVIVFIFGHTVNMAINLIGTYVHTNRLQYVEFFAKFYEGGGRSFTPFKTNTKYFNVKEDN